MYMLCLRRRLHNAGVRFLTAALPAATVTPVYSLNVRAKNRQSTAVTSLMLVVRLLRKHPPPT